MLAEMARVIAIANQKVRRAHRIVMSTGAVSAAASRLALRVKSIQQR